MGTQGVRAHLFISDDGGGMVTGTHDVALARRLLAREWLHAHGDTEDGPNRRRDVAEASYRFRARRARLEVGRVIPTPSDLEDWAWEWRPGYQLGKPGVTRAVVWAL